MTEQLTTTAPPEEDQPYRWRWFAFSVVLLASVMNLLDVQVTNIAAPSIGAEIGGGPALIQWLGASYTLALAAGLITGGRLGDIYGRKKIFLVGAIGFTAASLACAVSTTPGMLIASRVVQGLFGAVMLPQGLGVIRSTFPPRELSRAFGLFGPAMGLASVAGPVLAGGLIAADLFGTGWRMIFLINLPLGLWAILAGLRFLPSHQVRGAARLDVLGAGIAAVAALLLVYPVVQGRELDWPAWTFGLMLASLVLCVVFARVEARTARRGGDPLVVPSLFSNRAFSGGLVTALAVFASMIGFGLVLTVFLQMGLGFSALKAGLTVLPQAVGSMAGFVAAGAGLTARLGRKALQVGVTLMITGALGVFAALTAAGSDVTGWHLAPALLVYGAGLGLFLSTFFDIVLAGVLPNEYGSASGTLNAFQQFAGALGVAVLGTVFFTVLGGHVGQAVADAGQELRPRLAAVGVSTAGQDRIIDALRARDADQAGTEGPTGRTGFDQCRAAARVAAEVVTEGSGAPTAGSANPTGSTDLAAVGSALREECTAATRLGFAWTLRQTLWTVMALLAVAFALTFLLPPYARRAKPDTSWTEAKNAS